MKTNILKILMIILLIVFPIFIILYGFYNKNSLKRNYTILTCKIVEVWAGTKGSPNSVKVKFEYFINNKRYYNDVQYDKSIALSVWKNEILGKNFPVAIDSTNYKNSYPMILPENFEFYNLPYPDSLKWVLTLIK